jgi:hypothetical protein
VVAASRVAEPSSKPYSWSRSWWIASNTGGNLTILRNARRALSILCLVVLALAAPTAATAVNVSSNDGSGVQNVTTWYGNGAYLDGTLRSTHGNPVYYSGQVAINNCDDSTYGRYTGNVTSTSGMGAGGQISALIGFWPCSFEGVKARVCRDVSFAPDPCGSWSSTMKP